MPKKNSSLALACLSVRRGARSWRVGCAAKKTGRKQSSCHRTTLALHVAEVLQAECHLEEVVEDHVAVALVGEPHGARRVVHHGLIGLDRRRPLPRVLDLPHLLVVRVHDAPVEPRDGILRAAPAAELVRVLLHTAPCLRPAGEAPRLAAGPVGVRDRQHDHLASAVGVEPAHVPQGVLEAARLGVVPVRLAVARRPLAVHRRSLAAVEPVVRVAREAAALLRDGDVVQKDDRVVGRRDASSLQGVQQQLELGARRRRVVLRLPAVAHDEAAVARRGAAHKGTLRQILSTREGPAAGGEVLEGVHAHPRDVGLLAEGGEADVVVGGGRHEPEEGAQLAAHAHVVARAPGGHAQSGRARLLRGDVSLDRQAHDVEGVEHDPL
mmetsp:Transcript_26674/g.85729  ORF Transcript_26674/g.85729 Transcript_26674/m.85729 type:complete len:381 (+) Transcript_26674:161-1303(+)